VKAQKENQTVSIKVSTDSIAQHLHNVVSEHPNADALVDTIIGVGLTTGKLGHMFMGALGVVPIQQFGIGEEVICTDSVYDYLNTEGSDRPDYREIGACRIKSYRPYDDSQYAVEYYRINKDGARVTDVAYVCSDTLSAMPLLPPTEIHNVL